MYMYISHEYHRLVSVCHMSSQKKSTSGAKSCLPSLGRTSAAETQCHDPVEGLRNTQVSDMLFKKKKE